MESKCPNCGHCPTCGRSDFKPYSPYDVQPHTPITWPYVPIWVVPQPQWMNPQPWWYGDAMFSTGGATIVGTTITVSTTNNDGVS